MYIDILEQTKGMLKIITYLSRNGKTEIFTISEDNNIPRKTCYTALRRLENTGLITTFKARSRPPKVYCRLTQRGTGIAGHLIKIDAMLEDTLEGYKRQLLWMKHEGKPGEIRDKKRLEILRKLTRENINCGKLVEAMMNAKDARRLSQRLHDNDALAEALRNMGNIHHLRHEFNAAEKCFQKSSRLAEKLKDYKGMASVKYSLGAIFERKGNYPKAMALYKRSKEYAEKCDCEIEKGRGHLGIGRILARKGRYEEAIENMEKAVEIFERLKSIEDLPRAYTNLGATEFYINIDNAIKWHEKCLKISEKEGNVRMLGYGFSNAAGCYIKKMEFEKARKYLDRALPIFRSLEEKVMTSSILTKYARISLAKRRPKHAMKYLDRAMEIAKDVGIPSETADVLLQFGITLKERGEHPKARSSFKKALKIYTDLGSKKKIEKVKKELENLSSPKTTPRHLRANPALRR